MIEGTTPARTRAARRRSRRPIARWSESGRGARWTLQRRTPPRVPLALDDRPGEASGVEEVRELPDASARPAPAPAPSGPSVRNAPSGRWPGARVLAPAARAE